MAAIETTSRIVVRAIRRGQKTKDEVLAILRSLPAVSTLHVRRSFLDEIVGQVERTK